MAKCQSTSTGTVEIYNSSECLPDTVIAQNDKHLSVSFDRVMCSSNRDNCAASLEVADGDFTDDTCERHMYGRLPRTVVDVRWLNRCYNPYYEDSYFTCEDNMITRNYWHSRLSECSGAPEIRLQGEGCRGSDYIRNYRILCFQKQAVTITYACEPKDSYRALNRTHMNLLAQLCKETVISETDVSQYSAQCSVSPCDHNYEVNRRLGVDNGGQTANDGVIFTATANLATEREMDEIQSKLNSVNMLNKVQNLCEPIMLRGSELDAEACQKLKALELSPTLDPTSALSNSPTYSPSSSPLTASPTKQPSPERAIGGDRDEHDCIGSAGYTWCEATSKCQKLWEHPCESAPPTVRSPLGSNDSWSWEHTLGICLFGLCCVGLLVLMVWGVYKLQQNNSRHSKVRVRQHDLEADEDVEQGERGETQIEMESAPNHRESIR